MSKFYTKKELLERHRQKITDILKDNAGDIETAIEILTRYVASRISTVISCERRRAKKELHPSMKKGSKTYGKIRATPEDRLQF